MNKDELLEIIIKAFGIYLLVLAIIAVPKMLEGVMALALSLFQGELDFMNKTTVISVSIIAVAIVVCFGIYIHGTRYSSVNAGKGKVYRIDRQPGEAVLIYGSKETILGQDESEEKTEQERKLTSTELSKLDGRAGLSFSNYFSGSVYNGNHDITVTELRIKVSTTVNGKNVTRSYRDEVLITPQETTDFGVRIIVGDKGSEYKWHIENATGRPVK